MKRNASVITAGLLTAALMAASPFALADHHGKNKQGGKWDKQEMCENFREGKGPFNREERREAMEERRAEMADRLKLTDEQREIWAQMHAEQREKYQQRMQQWQEKMEQRCGENGERGKNRK